MIQKVKINYKGSKIAELEFGTDDNGNHCKLASENVENQFVDWEQTNQGFIEVLEIDIKKSPSELVLADIQYVYKEIGYIEGFFDADEYGREKGIAEALGNIFSVANKYNNFKYVYNQEEWDKNDNTYDDIDFSESDFYDINITDENHPKASYVADDFATELIAYLKKQLMEMI